MLKRKILLLIALLFVVLFFVCHIFDIQILNVVSKTLPVLLFAILLPRKNKFQKYIFIGFIFSALGDLLLELPYDLFMFGLLAFLLAHVNFILGFLSRDKSIQGISAIILLLVGISIFLFLYDYLGEMKIAVAIYMLVILIMVWRAFAQRKVDKYSVLAFWGALLFMFSDTNIAFDKFYHPYSLSFVVIMLTYWLGQYLIFLAAEKSSEV